MEELREKMYKYIEKYGLLDPRTFQLSKQLDIYIAKVTKKKAEKNK